MQQLVVFISSVVRDLKDTRKSVKEMLERSLGYKVVTSETEGSYASSSVLTCKRLARNCDIYIGIFGQKYGTLVPRLGISFTEMEFAEAYKDNPEKILIYVKTGEQEPRQKTFLRKVKDASLGYFARNPFKNDEELIEGIKEDIANFVKERLDIVRKKGLKVIKRVTPLEKDYAYTSRHNRAIRMVKDALDIVCSKGFHLERDIYSEWNLKRPSYYEPELNFLDLPTCCKEDSFSENLIFTLACPFFGCSKKINNKVLWLLIFAFPEDFKAQYVNYLHSVFRWIGKIEHTGTKRIAVNHFWYNKNILSIFLVHGKTTEPSVRPLGAVCFKTEAGIYAGEPINLFPSKIEIESSWWRPVPKHMLFAQGVKNKTIMDSKINDILHWLNSLDF